jgi:hypothetical protein
MRKVLDSTILVSCFGWMLPDRESMTVFVTLTPATPENHKATAKYPAATISVHQAFAFFRALHLLDLLKDERGLDEVADLVVSEIDVQNSQDHFGGNFDVDFLSHLD